MYLLAIIFTAVFLLIVSFIHINRLNRKVSRIKTETELSLKAAKNYNESVAKLKKESSEHLGRYEKLRSEVSDVLGFIQGNGKRKLYFSILEYDKQKRPGGSLISGIVLDKIHHLNRPIPPTPRV